MIFPALLPVQDPAWRHPPDLPGFLLLLACQNTTIISYLIKLTMLAWPMLVDLWLFIVKNKS
jgi:hypothetical protein